MKDSFAHVSDVLARDQWNTIRFVYVLTMATNLFDKDLGRLLVDLIQCLFFVILMSFWELCDDLGRLGCIPSDRQSVRRL